MSSIAVQPDTERAAEPKLISPRTLVALWIAAGIVLLVGLGNPPVSRTQEARVLETARQMLGRSFEDWMIPKLNGRVRLQKPPLPYWLSAVSYSIGGVSEFTGRLPFALAAWLTLGVTFAGAAWIFASRRIALFAALCLLGSFFFARFMRLAETDGPATLFVTLATLAFWRAIASRDRDWIWFHIAALGVGLTIMSKGAPGIFPILFFTAMVVIERRWDALWRFVRCGAPLTLAIVALPWFAYVWRHEGFDTFYRELRNNYIGGDHNRPLLQYIPGILVGTAPWSAVFVLAIAVAIHQWRRDARVRGVLLWFGSIAIPLCLTGNRQNHYLLPLMAPAMILVAWAIDRALRLYDRQSLTVILANIVVVALAPIAVLVAARLGSAIEGRDILAAGALALASMVIIAVARMRGWAGAIGAFVWAVALLLPPLLALWAPRLRAENPRELARQIQRNVGDGPFRFFGVNESLPLCFNLRQAIPTLMSDEQVRDAARSLPGVTLVAIDKEGRESSPPPAPFGLVHTIRRDEQVLRFYRAAAP